jgi:phage terminase small subunit
VAELKPKQQRFVEEYLIDLNATAAYKRAGYKGRGRAAENAASRLLGNADVQVAIQAGVKLRSEAVGLTVDRIWAEWRRIAFSDVGDILDFSGTDPTLRPANEISEDARRALASVKVKRYVDGIGDAARTVEIIEFKFWDKPGALRDAANALNMFKEHLEVSGEVEIVGIEVISQPRRVVPPGAAA